MHCFILRNYNSRWCIHIVRLFDQTSGHSCILHSAQWTYSRIHILVKFQRRSFELNHLNLINNATIITHRCAILTFIQHFFYSALSKPYLNLFLLLGEVHGIKKMKKKLTVHLEIINDHGRRTTWSITIDNRSIFSVLKWIDYGR